jgi:hypothetical protein
MKLQPVGYKWRLQGYSDLLGMLDSLAPGVISRQNGARASGLPGTDSQMSQEQFVQAALCKSEHHPRINGLLRKSGKSTFIDSAKDL